MAVTGFINASGGEDFTFASFHAVTSRSFTPTTYGSAGETMVVFGSYADRFGGSETALIPSGWTAAASNADPYHGINAFYKTLDGSETISISTFTSGADSYLTQILRFSGPSSVSHSLQYGSTTTGDPTEQSLVIAGYTNPVVVLAFYSIHDTSNSAITNATFSPSEDATNLSADQLAAVVWHRTKASYKIYNTSPQNTTVDLDDDAENNGLITFVLESI